MNNSSVGSPRGNPELPAYGAMKRAVSSLDESSPGVIDQFSAQNPPRRAATPEEIAEAAARLLKTAPPRQ